jgi:hypothetical protein
MISESGLFVADHGLREWGLMTQNKVGDGAEVRGAQTQVGDCMAREITPERNKPKLRTEAFDSQGEPSFTTACARRSALK